MKKLLLLGAMLLGSNAHAKDCKITSITTICKGLLGESVLTGAEYYLSIDSDIKGMKMLIADGVKCDTVYKNTKMKVISTQRSKTTENLDFEFYTKKVLYKDNIWFVESKFCK